MACSNEQKGAPLNAFRILLAILFTIGIGALLVIPLFFVLWVLELVLGVVAGLQAHQGRRYRYPFALRLLG